MVVSPIQTTNPSPLDVEHNITTAILATTATSDVRTAIDTLHDAREEARVARQESASLRARAADALKAAEETDAIASQAEAEVAAALDILGRAQQRAVTRARHVNSPIGATAVVQPASDVGKDVVVYTDGSCVPGQHSAIGVFFGAGHPLNAGVSLRANRHDPGLCELAAIQCALRLLHTNPETRNRPIVIRTDYHNVLNSSRHQSDRVFRAEYDRLRNLIDQFPRGVRYEHVEAHRGAFSNNEAHRLARDALREAVRVANPNARIRTNSAASTASTRAKIKDSAPSIARSQSKSISRTSHTASMSTSGGRTGRDKSQANSGSSKSTAASTAKSILPTATARSGATTANSTSSMSKRKAVSSRPAAPAASKTTNSSTRSTSGKRPGHAQFAQPQTSVRVAKASKLSTMKSSRSKSVAVSTAGSINSQTRSKRSKRSKLATRPISKPVSKKSVRQMLASVEKENITTARATSKPRTPGRSPKKSDSTASKKSAKSTRSILKRPRTPAPETKSADKRSTTKSTKSARQTAISSSRSAGRQSAVSGTQNTNSSASRGSGASGRK